jgi:hypothetical protein
VSFFNEKRFNAMSRRLISFLRQKEGNRIAYGERGTKTFDEIFDIHPLLSDKNKVHFKNMNLITQEWGAKKDITILNAGYTLGLLKKIADNDIGDVVTFYELAKLTVLRFTKEKVINPDAWFKKVSTMFWLSNPQASDKLNYWNELDSKQRDSVLQMSLELYGAPAYKNIETKKLGIENLNEKMIYLFLHSNIHLSSLINTKLNKIEEVVHYNLNQNKPINYDILTSMIDTKNINPYVINMCINYPSNLDLDKINVPVSKMKESTVLIIDTAKEVIPLRDFYELINIQSWLLKKKNSFYDKEPKEVINDFSFTPYRTSQEIMSGYDRNNEFIHKSLIKFIEKQKSSCNEKTKKEEVDLWMVAKLDISLLEKPKGKGLKKI